MNERNDEQLRELLRKALPEVDAELKRDLWPEMLRKLEEPAPRAWLDWAFAGLLAAFFVAFPEMILLLLYHL